MATLPLTAAAKIASYQLLPPNGLPVEEAQATHRINLLHSWSAIAPGSTILEIGCGQGNCTAVLAEAVGATGHVDAIDPASPDYGSPFTLAQAQSHISQSEIGSRVTWHKASPEDFLAGQGERTWDVAVLTHCIWYFKSPEVLESVFRALKGRVKKVCIAEYALKASDASAVPHVLAALTRGVLEAHKAESSQNIQTPLAPDGIVAVARRVGWSLDAETFVVPGEGLLDGTWEAGTVVSSAFLREIEESIGDDRVKVVLNSSRASVVAAVEAVGGVKKVRTMDVWTGTFSLSTE